MTVKEIREKGYLIYEVIAGSRLYGQHTLDSDTNIIGVYILPQALLMGGFGDHSYSKEGIQIFDSNKYSVIHEVDEKTKLDIKYYELRHYLKLLKNGVPQAIEILFAPQSHVMAIKEPFMELKNKRVNFITKRCLYSFGYSSLGLYEKIRKLRDYQLGKELVDFFSVIPEKTEKLTEAKSLRKFLATDLLPLDSICVESAGIKNIYYLRGSYKLKYAKEAIANQSKPWVGQKIYPGLELDADGKLKEYKFGSNPLYEQTYPLLTRGLVYFDKEAYEKYVKLKANSSELLGNSNDLDYAYHPKKLAHAYRLIEHCMELAESKNITFPLKFPNVYSDIRKNATKHSVLSMVFNTRSAKLEQLYDGISDDVDAEWLQQLEIAMRGRHYLLNATEKNIS